MYICLCKRAEKWLYVCRCVMYVSTMDAISSSNTRTSPLIHLSDHVDNDNDYDKNDNNNNNSDFFI